MRVQYMSVSRETKECTFHVKLQQIGLGDPPTPAGRFEHEIVKIAGRDARNARRLRQRCGTHAIKLLSRFRGECTQLDVRQVGRQDERREFGKTGRGLALSREVAVVLDLD